MALQSHLAGLKLQQQRSFKPNSRSNPIAPQASFDRLSLFSLLVVLLLHGWLLHYFAGEESAASNSPPPPQQFEVALMPSHQAVVPPSGTSKSVASQPTPTDQPEDAVPKFTRPAAKELRPLAMPNEDESMPLMRDLAVRYFNSRELSEKPQVVEDVVNDMALDIPGAQAQTLVILLYINEEGNVDKVELIRANLPQELALKVADNFVRLKFTPGKLHGVAVKSLLKIEVQLEASHSTKIQTGGAK